MKLNDFIALIICIVLAAVWIEKDDIAKFFKGDTKTQVTEPEKKQNKTNTGSPAPGNPAPPAQAAPEQVSIQENCVNGVCVQPPAQIQVKQQPTYYYPARRGLFGRR